MATGVGSWMPCSSSAASAKRNETVNRNHHHFSKLQQTGKKKPKSSRLITVSTWDGRWHGKWECDYLFTLHDLGLNELTEDVNKDTDVHITLSIHKHAGLGLSVEGRIRMSFTAKCCNCCTPFLREIDAPLKAWILSSTRKTREDSAIPTIGDEDPCVVLVKPGYEADLDPLVQDAARLAISESCSEYCDEWEAKLRNMGVRNGAASSSMDQRWFKLLELKNKRLPTNS